MEPTTKKSVVTQVEYKSSGTNAYGPVHFFTVTFENGDKGDYGSSYNPQNKFVVGHEVEYTISTKTNGNFTNYYIKPSLANSYRGKGKQENVKAANAREALRCATMLIVAGCYPPDQLKEVRARFNAWLNENSI